MVSRVTQLPARPGGRRSKVERRRSKVGSGRDRDRNRCPEQMPASVNSGPLGGSPGYHCRGP